MLDLRPAQLELLEAIAFELSQISGVVAVVLGGSHARGSARPDSDLDVGYFGDKGAVEASDRFGKKPTQFLTRLLSALASPLAESPQLESAVRILEDLWQE